MKLVINCETEEERQQLRGYTDKSAWILATIIFNGDTDVYRVEGVIITEKGHIEINNEIA